MQQPSVPARRRWDDRPGAVVVLTFARFLTTAPSLDEAVRFLVGLLSWPISVYGARIVRIDDGHAVTLASFEEAIDDGVRIPDAERVDREVEEIVTAARKTGPVLWTDPDEPGRTPMAAWPLGHTVHPFNASLVLVVLLATPWDPDRVARRTLGVADALAVYLTCAPGTETAATRPRAVSPGSLTQRQLRVLGLLEDGLTLHQIASQIGFSESTVRMESLAIYRALDVHDRASAVAAAHERGILPLPGIPRR